MSYLISVLRFPYLLLKMGRKCNFDNKKNVLKFLWNSCLENKSNSQSLCFCGWRSHQFIGGCFNLDVPRYPALLNYPSLQIQVMVAGILKVWTWAPLSLCELHLPKDSISISINKPSKPVPACAHHLVKPWSANFICKCYSLCFSARSLDLLKYFYYFPKETFELIKVEYLLSKNVKNSPDSGCLCFTACLLFILWNDMLILLELR